MLCLTYLVQNCIPWTYFLSLQLSPPTFPPTQYHLESWAGDGQYRLSHSFNYTEADIQQYYFKPFKAAIRANVTAMSEFFFINVDSKVFSPPRILTFFFSP